MSARALALRAPEPPPLSELIELGKALSASGYFKDATDTAQAVTKVLAGRELGLGPIASMTGIFIVEGKVTLGANLMAAVVKASGRYNYRTRESTDQRALIAFYENGEEIGSSEFTLEDAKRAGLAGKRNWQQYPKNMLFWRALSNGAKMFCPDAFSGAPVYTPDELGAEVDPETGEVIELDAVPLQPAPEPESEPEPEPTHARARERESEPAATTEPAAAAVQEGPVSTPPALPADERITEAEHGKLVEFLDRIKVPRPMQQMALVSYGASDFSELTRGQAHELMASAKARYES